MGAFEDSVNKVKDTIAQSVLGYGSYEDLDTAQAATARRILDDFLRLTQDLDQVFRNIEEGTLPPSQVRALDYILKNEEIITSLVTGFVDVENARDGTGVVEAETEGYKLYLVIDTYRKLIQKREARNQSLLTTEDQIDAQLKQMGPFEGYLDHIDSYKKVQQRLGLRAGRRRNDNPPAQLAHWQCRIGASTFYVPPTSISVSQTMTASSLAGAAIRQPNSPKMNMGHSETMISMTLYFPTHESIWGFDGDRAEWSFNEWDPESNAFVEANNPVSDKIIDKYLSSLRGLVTQFRYTPFVPIDNAYLNRTHDITAVALKSMTVSTVQGFPFVAAVTLNMAKFNFTPYMPMINHFDQAIHWGKFRQMCARGAIHLDKRVNKTFLQETSVGKYKGIGPNGPEYDFDVVTDSNIRQPLNKAREISDGRNFDLYYPVGTPSKIFTADTTDFRQPGEDEVFSHGYWSFILGDLGFELGERPEFNFFDFDNKRAFGSNERDVLRRWMEVNTVMWQNMTSSKFDKFLEEALSKPEVNNSNRESLKLRYKNEWFFMLFDDLLKKDPIFQKLAEAKESNQTDYIIKEWEVPMAKVEIDWTRCIIDGVAVSMSNTFAKLQLQLQDEPTYQHIGGGDSTVDVSMTVLGEDNLINMRRVFQHINGLARIERSHGVLGFLGIRNIFTAICGIKYALPISFDVDTIPNYPGCYKVRMSFVDFDVMQQQREKLDSKQQAELIEQFGKRNPFLRIKQSWSQVNCYPDFPLDVRDDDGKVLGHLDPDWYFRSFEADNTDLVNWGVDNKVLELIQEYAELQTILERNDSSAGTIVNNEIRLAEIRQELASLAENKTPFPPGWKIDERGQLVTLEGDEKYNPRDREYRYYLGAYGEGQDSISVLDMFPGGYFAVGQQKKGEEEVTYSTGMSFLSEDLASKNLARMPSLEGTSKTSDNQHEYIDAGLNPQRQYESMMQDMNYRRQSGRMIKAFPTYMLWLIDEGGQFAGMKLFDNLYGLNSIVDFSVSSSTEDPISDTLVLRLSNIYQKLSTPYSESIIGEDDQLAETPIGIAITTIENRIKNIKSGLFDNVVDIENIRLKPGVRVHLRSGWGNNPNQLQTIFNGTITEVQSGPLMTVVAQSDAVEFSAFVNSQSTNGHSGELDGAMGNFWLSEPRDLIVRLLSMGTSNFKEWLSWGSKGVIFSESRFGIRHFGSMLFTPMTQSEVTGTHNKQVDMAANSRQVTISNDGNMSGLLGDMAGAFSEVDSISDIVNIPSYGGQMAAVANALWFRSFARRDYEIFKRNVYPGNGTGMAQFMGGDLLDAGIIVSQAKSVDEDKLDPVNPLLTTPDSADAENNNWLTGDLTEMAAQLGNIRGANRETIDEFWKSYFKEGGTGLSEGELQSMFERSSTTATDITVKPSEGFLSKLLDFTVDFYSLPDNLIDYAFDQLPDEGRAGDTASIVRNAVVLASPASFIPKFLSVGAGMINGLGRFVASPMGQALGLSQIVRDDDIAGFDEVSFRAQTYMKSIWDLFEVCAALLPNYIVAVRPFEDRSTLFYGKPHWQYTSGVIPVTTGIRTDQQASNIMEDPDTITSGLLAEVNSTNPDLERMMNVAKQAGEFRDITKILGNNIDPYNVGSTGSQQALVDDTQLAMIISGADFEEQNVDVLEAFKAVDYSQLTEGEITALVMSIQESEEYDLSDEVSFDLYVDAGNLLQNLDIDTSNPLGDQVYNSYEDFISVYSKGKNAQTEYNNFLSQYLKYRDRTSTINVVSNNDWQALMEQIEKAGLGKLETGNLLQLAKTDPITFAYQFGWRFSKVDAWIGPEANAGFDAIGELARQRYDEDYSATTEVIGGNKGRGVEDGLDIWLDFRNMFRYMADTQEAFRKFFPLDQDRDQFDAVVDVFMRFLWQDPFNRAWLVLRADRSEHAVDTWSGGVLSHDRWTGVDYYTGEKVEMQVGEKKWSFSGIVPAFEVFLSNSDIDFDGGGVPRSPQTKAWMKTNATQGSNTASAAGGAAASIDKWYDENIGQVLGLVMDSVSGLIASIRLSLAQLSQGLQTASEQQKQANMLNASLNDSIYYQMGEDSESLLRLVDNPFTREYYEPVVEIREPFQRVHMVSSFSDILSNQIMENLNGVATMVTAVSNGKSPVTVHLDKGVPPERQIEKIVETGLYFDNVSGSGLFGAIHPLINPLETLRGLNKGISGSSDQLSARRVGLYHLKNSLKKIYAGEIILMGNPEIRAWDLLYICDSYERIFGMVEVGQVIHHFTPETGFITSITPNALVTVNDPARWTMLSYMGNKMMNMGMRDEMRALMSIKTDRIVSNGMAYIESEDLYDQMSTYVNGAVQWTQGNTALVRDLGAVFAGGGIQALTKRDEQMNDIWKIDVGLKSLQGAGTILGAVGGGLASGLNPAGIAVGAGAGLGITQLAWEAWEYVKDNILDQQGCYISFLNKEGQPMDAGLSYFQGSAVGSNHSLSLFPNVFGIPSTKINYRDGDGHYRITNNDLLAKLGWTELETTAIYKDISLYVNQVNANVLDITGRGASQSISNDNFQYFLGRVLNPDGEDVGDDNRQNGVVDGDTLHVKVTDSGDSNFSVGEYVNIRIGAVNTSELQYKNNAYTDYNEVALNPENDLGRMAYEYLYTKFSNVQDYERIVAVRVRKSEPKDDYGRTIGIVFHNVPNGTSPSNRRHVLADYAKQNPPLPLQAYLDNGLPHTLNWELVMVGYGNVDMRDSLWDNNWTDDALQEF